MTLQLDKLKFNLARVFDDNLHTQQWHNIVDNKSYLIKIHLNPSSSITAVEGCHYYGGRPI